MTYKYSQHIIYLITTQMLTTAVQILLTLSNYNVQFEKNVYYIYLHLPVSLTADKMTTFDPNQPLLKHHMTLL